MAGLGAFNCKTCAELGAILFERSCGRATELLLASLTLLERSDIESVTEKHDELVSGPKLDVKPSHELAEEYPARITANEDKFDTFLYNECYQEALPNREQRFNRKAIEIRVVTNPLPIEKGTNSLGWGLFPLPHLTEHSGLHPGGIPHGWVVSPIPSQLTRGMSSDSRLPQESKGRV